MKKPLASALLLVPVLAQADNYATCMLDSLPGIQNDAAVYAAAQVCNGQHPERYSSVRQGSGRGFLAYKSGAECALEKSRDTRSQLAAQQIRVACNRLYDKPTAFDPSSAVLDE
ncbi:MAG TPA: hypothetical protein DCR72_12570 [Pseudomonas sp.]|nr:hypothetical protein [Pseudomonas sp.]